MHYKIYLYVCIELKLENTFLQAKKSPKGENHLKGKKEGVILQ